MRSIHLRHVVRVTVLLGALGATPSGADESASKWTIELELGPTWQSRNTVQIPNDERGTRFSLSDLAGSGPWFPPRVQISYTISGRHSAQLYLAPLSFTETGRLKNPTEFAGGSFSPDEPTEAGYRFDSWRASYRYQLVSGDRWSVWLGATLKVRDAEIRLRQGDIVARDTDTGLVPLFLFEADYRLTDRWHFLIDLDALAGGPGRAEDLALKLGYDLSDRWRLTAGYRMIEGGADVDEVYNFAWFHAAVVSAVYRF